MRGARSRISTGPTGECCSVCTAGTAPPEAPKCKKAIRRSLDHANGPIRARTSGTGALVVAKSPDDAALDHHRALRALFARDDAGGRPRSKAVGLLHFGTHRLKRHPHQRGGYLRLLLLVIGNTDRGENRLFQGRRVASYAPCAAFGLPVFP